MSQLSIEHQIREQMCAMLYKDYQQKIERYLMAWVHNQEIARDLCQDTFEYLCKFLLTKETVVKSAAKYKTDIYTTARFRAIDHLRRHNKPIVYLPQSESEADSWFEEPRTEGFEDHINWICTQDDLLQLPSEQRDSLVKYALGYEQTEIAKEKGKSEPTISGYMKRGRTNLRNKKSFVVTADLEERKRVSREIDRITSILVSAEVAMVCKMLSNLRHGGYFKEEKLLDPYDTEVDYELKYNEELRSKLLLETDPFVNVFVDYFGKGTKIRHGYVNDSFVEEFGAEVKELLTPNERSMNFERLIDRTMRKPLRRAVIDAENKKRGLLSDTAVLGDCGQYLF